MKIFITLMFFLFFISACSSNREQSGQQMSGGIVTKPQSSEVRRPGERLNTMLLMDIEEAAAEMDEVIVIPPVAKESE